MNTRRVLLWIGCLSLAITLGSQATTIGLYNTGTGPDGSKLGDETVQPGWQIISVYPGNPPGGLTPTEPPSSAFVVGAAYNWLQNNPGDASKWISYSTPLFTGGDVNREFLYSLNFTASAGDTFWMRFAADNGSKAYLNGTGAGDLLGQIGVNDPGNYTAFASWTGWMQVGGLQDGLNSLIFQVRNLEQDYGNPTGLRVEFSFDPSGNTPAPVPESSPWIAGWLLLIPLGAETCKLLRRRSELLIGMLSLPKRLPG
jgi:hypothetical protein